jgi:hypothetical protein
MMMEERILAEHGGVAIYDSFEGAAVGGFRETTDGVFEVDCLEEPGVPEIAFLGVFFDYTFCIGVRNTTEQPQEATIRLHLCERSAARNMHFMQGPWWIGKGRDWHQAPMDCHQHGDDWVQVTLMLPPGRDAHLATRPFWTEREIDDILNEYVENLGFVSCRSIGATCDRRSIWIIETEPRDERIFIHSSLQGAEFAGDTVCHVLDWLGTGTRRTEELLERFSFSILPVPVPDSVAHGYSIMNATGRCPMFDFGPASRGEPCAEESHAIWQEITTVVPTMLLDVHVHPGAYSIPKLNNVKSSWYRDGACAARAMAAEQAMLSVCPDWRIVPVPLDDPDFHMQDSLMVLAARELGSATFCLQDYALTPDGTKPLLISILDAALGAI